MQRAPAAYGLEPSRWTLALLQGCIGWLQDLTLGGVQRLCTRLGVEWKRGAGHLYSPDPDYADKLAAVERCRAQVRAGPQRFALVYQDEMSVLRVPSVANVWATRGKQTPRAEWGYRANAVTRLVGSLDALTGRVVMRRTTKVSLGQLVGFYQALAAAYPHAETIYVVQDSWPIHIHPDVLVALPPQTYAHWFRPPRKWATEPSAAARRRWGELQLPLQLLPLPTYAPWTNPIEKLWRLCRQTVTHMHAYADDVEGLRRALDRFFAQYQRPSPTLLRYVGL